MIDKFDFDAQITRLDRANLLYLVVAKFADIDLHPDAVSNLEMGYLYEELIRRFSELSNETAGEHFTPREVIRLMVNLLFTEDDELLTKPGIVKTLLDPACGTGGMLSVAEDHLRELNPERDLEVYGQELNAETYAICRSDMMIKGQDADTHRVRQLLLRRRPRRRAASTTCWPTRRSASSGRRSPTSVKAEHDRDGFDGRFGAGLPRINDGSFLFLQHMISKMKPADAGRHAGWRSSSTARRCSPARPAPASRRSAGGSSRTTGSKPSSRCRTSCSTTPASPPTSGSSPTARAPERRGKVQLVDARELFAKMRKSLGEKRKEISAEQIAEITRLYGDFAENERVKILPNESFGFLRITVERPLRLRWEVTDDTLAVFRTHPKIVNLSDEARAMLETGLTHWGDEVITDVKLATKRVAELLAAAAQRGKPLQKAVLESLAVRDPDAPPVLDDKDNIEPDPELRDYENVSLPTAPLTFEADYTYRLTAIEYRSAIDDYMEVEVLPYVADAWVDHTKTKIGYEIPVTRHFYKYVPPRPLAEIDAEIKQLEKEIQALLNEVTD